MPHKTFMAFIWPSLLAMVLFIALPILSVGYQSLFIEHKQILIEAETCGPFGCNKEVAVDVEAMAELRAEQPAGRFNGLGWCWYFNGIRILVILIKKLVTINTT